jgi:hypothetical protein
MTISKALREIVLVPILKKGTEMGLTTNKLIPVGVWGICYDSDMLF